MVPPESAVCNDRDLIQHFNIPEGKILSRGHRMPKASLVGFLGFLLSLRHCFGSIFNDLVITLIVCLS